jgi:hypothetical protein
MSAPPRGQQRPGSREPAMPRHRVLALLALGAVLAAVTMASIDLLRHVDEGVELEVDAGVDDPRDPIDCSGFEPREGDREEPLDAQQLPPVTVGSGDVLDCPQLFDGRRVVFTGEAVGQILGRGDRRWVQVNDDIYADEAGPLPAHRFYAGGNSGLGVSAAPEHLAEVRVLGGPRAHGDLVEVHGTFHRVDPASGEMAIIAAERIEVLRPGRPLEQAGLRDRQVVAYLLFVGAAGATWLRLRRRARRVAGG